jgi:2-oxoglutarate dehydrogenase E1 component
MSALFEEFGSNSGYIEQLHALYLTDPSLVGEEWVRFFASRGVTHPSVVHLAPVARSKGAQSSSDITSYGNGYKNGFPSHTGEVPTKDLIGVGTRDEKVSVELVEQLLSAIDAYRRVGHLSAKTNPLTSGIVSIAPSKDIENVQNSPWVSSSQEVPWFGFKGQRLGSAQELFRSLEECYCGSVGFEYAHVQDTDIRSWLREKIETRKGYRAEVSAQVLRMRLQQMLHAELLEDGLHKKYVGAKRFSVEGLETLLPVVATLLHEAPRHGVVASVIGMAHRGRLATLTNIMQRPLEDLFCDFEDKTSGTSFGAGDVKYHNGYQCDFKTLDGSTVSVKLSSNPSHLEVINSVVAGYARARRDLLEVPLRSAVMPIQIHGDAAFIGQGVVPEVINLSLLKGYECGGSIHLVANNQVGFTTTSDESRSSIYCSDFAKAFDIPVFHVNAEDVDAACWVASLALEYRATFQRDVVIDLIGFRKYGHNEGDDPTFTQPDMYSEIKGRQSLPNSYATTLVGDGSLLDSEVSAIKEDFNNYFRRARDVASARVVGEGCSLHGLLHSESRPNPSDASILEKVARGLSSFPEGFIPHPKVGQLLAKRTAAYEGDSGIDWGFAEALALGSILSEGIHVRISGQDSERGTFSHRHAVVDNYNFLGAGHSDVQRSFCGLQELGFSGNIVVLNSALSEVGVLGFEYGYSVAADTKSLVMWEAQFGDFSNGAQVLFDQFLAASDAKWGERSGLVVLLPHGYEGQGPEHSSARLERCLQLCAEGNLSVCFPSNAAQYFHLLRRQAALSVKRPLIVMTPKSLLRLPDATARKKEILDGSFQSVLVNEFGKKNSSDKKTVICAGKVYYDIAQAVTSSQKHVKVVRVEELYPFPESLLSSLIKVKKGEGVLWVQEEPKNQGAWMYIEPSLRALFGSVAYAGRPESASTACGSPSWHAKEQKALVSAMLDWIG